MPVVVDQKFLWMVDATSDKIYHLFLEQDNRLFSVRFEYGKRGREPNVSYKKRNVNEWDARRTFDKYYNEKTREGYKPYNPAARDLDRQLADQRAKLSKAEPKRRRSRASERRVTPPALTPTTPSTMVLLKTRRTFSSEKV